MVDTYLLIELEHAPPGILLGHTRIQVAITYSGVAITLLFLRSRYGMRIHVYDHLYLLLCGRTKELHDPH